MRVTRNTTTRRRFLRETSATLAGVVGFPYIIPSSVLGADGDVAPSNRITMGCIGVGGRGSGNMRAFLQDPRVQVVAVCDVDARHRESARNVANLPPDSACNDFREIVARDDIDAVSIGTPDHWHAVMVIGAAQSGQDIFCEKPLSLAIADGRAICDAVKRYGRVLQTGTWRRSRSACRFACELVRNGRIGELKTIRTYVPTGYAIRGGDYAGIQPPQPVPEGLDYDMWLGPAPWAPYTPGRVHFNFRWIIDYSEGYISDWGAHYYDVAQWGNGADETGPVDIEGRAEFPKDGLYDAAIDHLVEFKYANGVTMISATSANAEGKNWGTHFEGTEGSIYVESGTVVSKPESIVRSVLGPNDILLYNSKDHYRNFIDCVISREDTAATAEIGHRSASICHLGSIATLLGRKLEWDPEVERFTNDDEANRMLARPMRAPWRV